MYKRMYTDEEIKKIAATGNLYVHNVHIYRDNNTNAYATIYSSNIKSITSLAILKEYLGNEFDYPATGYDDATSQPIWRMSNPGGLYPGDDPVISWNSLNITDTVVKM